MLRKTTSHALCAALTLSFLASVQAAGTPTITARQDSGNPLETLASIGQAGLSLLGSFLGQNTPAATAVLTVTVSPTTDASTTDSFASSTSSSQSASTTQSTTSASNTGLSSTAQSTATSASSTAASTIVKTASSSTSTSATLNSANQASPTAKSTSNDASGKHTSNTLAIALGVVGGVLLLALLAFLLWFCCVRRRKHRTRPDSPLSDSDLGEKALVTEKGGSSYVNDGPSLHQQLRDPLLHSPYGIAAAAERKSASSNSQRNSWNHRSSATSSTRSTAYDPFEDGANNWHGNGPVSPPATVRKDPRSWTPVVSPGANSWESADARTPLVSHVAPSHADRGDDGAAIEVFSPQSGRQNGTLTPVQEEREEYARRREEESAGALNKPLARRRYSGGSAWTPGNGSLQRPRSTPLSPLAQLPMMPVGGKDTGGRGGQAAGFFDSSGTQRSSWSMRKPVNGLQ